MLIKLTSQVLVCCQASHAAHQRRNMHLVCSFLFALRVPLQSPRLLAAGLTPAERSATALAFESAGFLEPVEFVEFSCRRRALLVPDSFYDDELLTKAE